MERKGPQFERADPMPRPDTCMTDPCSFIYSFSRLTLSIPFSAQLTDSFLLTFISSCNTLLTITFGARKTYSQLLQMHRLQCSTEPQLGHTFVNAIKRGHGITWKVDTP